MSKSPAYQWYPKDILASARVQEMSLAEEGAYRRLLDYCWLNGSVPTDEKRCARLIGKGATPEMAKYILEMFVPHPTDPDKKIHDRLEAERAKQESNSEARKLASKARWDKRGTSADARGKQAISELDANALQAEFTLDALSLNNGHSTPSVREKPTDLIKNNANAMQMHTSPDANALQTESFAIATPVAIKKKNTSVFQKPPRSEIETYFLALKSTKSEANNFEDHYDSNGWKVGKTRMVDWRASARKWLKSEYNKNTNGTQPPQRQVVI